MPAQVPNTGFPAAMCAAMGFEQAGRSQQLALRGAFATWAGSRDRSNRRNPRPRAAASTARRGDPAWRRVRRTRPCTARMPVTPCFAASTPADSSFEMYSTATTITVPVLSDVPAPRCFSLPAEPASRMRRAGRHSPRAAMMVSISSSLMPTMASPKLVGQLGQQLGVLIVGHRLDDGGGPLGRVAGLEDARAHEHALGPQLHHQGGIGRGGHAAGGKVHHGQTAMVVDILDQLHGHLQAAWPPHTARPRAGPGPGGSPRSWRACGARPGSRRRCPARPWCGSWTRPSAIRRSASPRSLAPQTNGTWNFVLSM